MYGAWGGEGGGESGGKFLRTDAESNKQVLQVVFTINITNITVFAQVMYLGMYFPSMAENKLSDMSLLQI